MEAVGRGSLISEAGVGNTTWKTYKSSRKKVLRDIQDRPHLHFIFFLSLSLCPFVPFHSVPESAPPQTRGTWLSSCSEMSRIFFIFLSIFIFLCRSPSSPLGSLIQKKGDHAPIFFKCRKLKRSQGEQGRPKPSWYFQSHSPRIHCSARRLKAIIGPPNIKGMCPSGSKYQRLFDFSWSRLLEMFSSAFDMSFRITIYTTGGCTVEAERH